MVKCVIDVVPDVPGPIPKDQLKEMLLAGGPLHTLPAPFGVATETQLRFSFDLVVLPQNNDRFLVCKVMNMKDSAMAGHTWSHGEIRSTPLHLLPCCRTSSEILQRKAEKTSMLALKNQETIHLASASSCVTPVRHLLGHLLFLHRKAPGKHLGASLDPV